jgi:hypothetical protein
MVARALLAVRIAIDMEEELRPAIIAAPRQNPSGEVQNQQ